MLSVAFALVWWPSPISRRKVSCRNESADKSFAFIADENAEGAVSG